MTDNQTSRRELLKQAGAIGAFTILDARLVRGTAANSAVRVGLLGCGRRGTTDALNIAQHTDARVTALADLFPDQIEKARQRLDTVARSKGYAGIAQTFIGPDSSQQMAASKEIDAMVIATPAYYHPEHLALVVAAGKHVYCEKPVAIDVPGAHHVLAIAKQAEGRLSLDVGFQIRSAPPFIELVRRIHAGALGDITTGAAYYYCPMPTYEDVTHASPAEGRIRNWLHDRRLSGDIIVEQNIHAIDICNWVLDAHPVKAVARGNRNGRTGAPDDMFSHFDVVFEYPKAVHVSFSSTQFGKCQFDVNERFFGTRGASQSPYSGALGISGDEPWTWAASDPAKQATFSASGSFSDNLADADSEKQKAFIASIVTGQFHNQAAQGVESALTAMLGRQAAYRGHEGTWEELQRSKERWEPGIDLKVFAR